MADIDKLLKYIKKGNIAEELDDDKQASITRRVINGCRVDFDSMGDWFERNHAAMDMINSITDNDLTLDIGEAAKPACKVIYPLIPHAVTQLASRQIPHINRDDTACEFAVKGRDPQKKKEQRATDVAEFMNFQLLEESDTWEMDSHKILHMTAAWGTVHREVYYDHIKNELISETIDPNNFIINNNLTSLSKARRITIKYQLSLNEIQERINIKEFQDIDIDSLTAHCDNIELEDVPKEDRLYEIKKQYCYLDLDEDGYAEPYIVFIHEMSDQLLAIYPNFIIDDIKVGPKGQIMAIRPNTQIVDFHCIPDPGGKYLSHGLNHRLYHLAKAITTLLRQLIDSGTLANFQGGFVTKAFKTKEKELRFKYGVFQELDVPSDIEGGIQNHIMQLPFKEPSQVAFSLMQFLVETSKDYAFTTDVLVGDTQAQNTPATTAMSQIEQATKAFAPLLKSMFISLKKEFKIRFDLNSKFLPQSKYAQFFDDPTKDVKEDFKEGDFDIVPVADPTMCSEAHKYARDQIIQQILLQNAPYLDNSMLCKELFTDLHLPVEAVKDMSQVPQQPNPIIVKANLDHDAAMQKNQVEVQKDQHRTMLEQQKIDLEKSKVSGHLYETGAKVQKLQADAMKDVAQTHLNVAQAHVDANNQNVQNAIAAHTSITGANIESAKVRAMANKPRNA